MRVEKEEVPFFDIRFKPKTERHEAFDKWAGRVMVQSGAKKLFNQLGS